MALKLSLTDKKKTSGGSLSLSTNKSNPILKAQESSSLYDHSPVAGSSAKSKQDGSNKGLGKGWFNIQPSEMDEKTKADVKLLQLRNYLDPKRFYKNPDKGGKILHVGTVVEGPTEYRTGRLTKKERKASFVDEILSDTKTRNYTRRVFMDIQATKSNKKKFHKSAKKGNKNAKPIRSLF